MMKPASSVRSVGRLSSWLIVTAGFVAYLGLVFSLDRAGARLGMPLPEWGAQALALVLYAIFHPTAREARRAAVEAENGLDEEEVELGPPEFVVIFDSNGGDDYEDEEPQPPRATSWPA